jgi:hypothetical protein
MTLHYTLKPTRKQLQKAETDGHLVISIVPPMFKKIPKMWLYILGIGYSSHNLIMYKHLQYSNDGLNHIKTQFEHAGHTSDICLTTGIYTHI